jgi:hypothetical protein
MQASGDALAQDIFHVQTGLLHDKVLKGLHRTISRYALK